MAQDAKETLTFRLDGQLAKLEATPQTAFRVMQALKTSSHGLQILDQGKFVEVTGKTLRKKKVA